MRKALQRKETFLRLLSWFFRSRLLLQIVLKLLVLDLQVSAEISAVDAGTSFKFFVTVGSPGTYGAH